MEMFRVGIGVGETKKARASDLGMRDCRRSRDMTWQDKQVLHSVTYGRSDHFRGTSEKIRLLHPHAHTQLTLFSKISIKVRAPSNFRQKGNFDDSLQRLIVK